MELSTIKQNYNAEIGLLVLCCRHYIKTADSCLINNYIKHNKIDWQKFYQLSAAHRIRPIVYNVITESKNLIDPEIYKNFHNYCFSLNVFALNNKRELLRIFSLLKQNNISAKPFKGIDFAEKFYGTIGLREFSDNDIIVMVSDLDKLIELMTNEGYTSKDIIYYKKFPKQYIRDYKDIIFEKMNGDSREFAFEFHFKTSRFYQQYSLSFKEVLGDDYLTEKRNYNNKDYLELMTVNNGLMDFYPDLRSLVDLVVINEKGNLFNTVITHPVLDNFFKYGQILSSEILNYQSKKNIFEGNELKFYNFLQNKILEMNVGSRLSLFQHFYYNFIITTSIKSKIRLIGNYLQLMVRPGIDDILTHKFPLHFLYYFTKPFRILYKLRGGDFNSK